MNGLNFQPHQKKIREVFKRLGIAESKEAVVVKVEEVEIRGISYGVEDGESLEKLQYLADLVTRLNENDRNLFEAIIEAMVDCAYCIDDMINLTFNLHKYEVIEAVWDKESLGEYYLEKAGFCDVEIAFNVWLSDYIDYGRLECALLQKEHGEYTNLGFITSIDDDFEEVFDGSVENIPEEFRLFPEED